MSPLVAQRLANARANFDGEIVVVRDLGDKAVVLIVPAKREHEGEEGADWGRITEPTYMLIDPARVQEGATQ